MAAVLRQVVCDFRFDHRCIWRAQRPAGAGQRGHGGERRLTGEALHIVSASFASLQMVTQTLTSYTEYRIKTCAGTYTANNMLILSGLVLKSKPLTFIISVTELSKSSLSPPKTSPVWKLVLLLQLNF